MVQAPWQPKSHEIISNGIFLKNRDVSLRVRRREYSSPASPQEPRVATGCPPAAEFVDVRVFGTDFFWPMTSPNPHYALMPAGLEVVISHGPCKGLVDSGRCAPRPAHARGRETKRSTARAGCERWLFQTTQIQLRIFESPPFAAGRGPSPRRRRPCRSGCSTLLKEVNRVRPRLVVCGHVHAAHGVARAGGTVFVNAASCGGGGYRVEWPPVVVDI